MPTRKTYAAAAKRCKAAKSPRVHTFIATSPIHMEKKLRMEPSQVIDQAVRAVKWAREYTDNVEFSPEDAGRSDIDFLCRILEQVITAGATTINVPDTVGYTLARECSAASFARCESACRIRTRSCGRSTAITISASPWRIRYRQC